MSLLYAEVFWMIFHEVHEILAKKCLLRPKICYCRLLHDTENSSTSLIDVSLIDEPACTTYSSYTADASMVWR